mmetsp:Transcript_13771/g.34408  ORF Transcript_13771/g.34408 Transcript_13771/m.34408 type:complete len:272 (-) Transcript_13771:54-869(-)
MSSPPSSSSSPSAHSPYPAPYPEASMVVVSLVSVLVVIFVCVFLWLVFPGFFGRRGRGFYKASSKSRKRGPSLLLVGPMNAGKTSLLLAMQRSQSCANGDSSALIPDTVTSMEVNETSVAKVDGKTMAVVDIPGHPRLSALVQEYAQRAKIVAFVIDSADFANRAREVAEALVDIVELAREQRARLVIVCNKSDRTIASPPSYVKTRLEKELSRVTSMEDDGLAAAGDGAGARKRRGNVTASGAKFTFDDDVQFVATSAKSAEVSELLSQL